MKLPFFDHEKEKEDIILQYEGIEEASESTSWVKDVHFSMLKNKSFVKVGECDLRLGMNDEIYYAGQVGYRVYFPFRGHGYAYEACKILFEIAKNEYDMKDLIITCSPDNIPSNKTLEKLHGILVEKIDVPETHWLYVRGETVKYIYRFIL